MSSQENSNVHSYDTATLNSQKTEVDVGEDSTVGTTNVSHAVEKVGSEENNEKKQAVVSDTEEDIIRTLSNSSIKQMGSNFNTQSTVKANNLKEEQVLNRPNLPSSFLATESEVPVIFDDGNDKKRKKNKVKNEDNIIPAQGVIRLGICAMDKKARSKPMSEILARLDKSLFEVIIFGDPMILDQPVVEWPIVDVLIAFHSTNYPLEKAQEYVALRKPFVLNDLDMQDNLKDRRRVYDLLQESGIDVPRHVYLSLDGYKSSGMGAGNGKNDGVLIEHDDHIEVNGVTIQKPFVEKPINADDHNIAIYYPSSAGGGCKKLFRKVGNRSSEFYPDISNVRRNGSYIYEEFVETQGTDVKMYTVGPDYGHAEARKSPAVDGKVERNSDGKEMRFPVILTLREKEIARRIVVKFKQQVCGFDLLRVQQADSLVSYVCDVNGWSFVKNSRKYYDDCAQILTEHMLAAVKPNSFRYFSALNPLTTTMRDDSGAMSPLGNKMRSPKHHKNPKIALQRASTILSEAPTRNRSHSPSPNSQSVTTLDTSACPIRDIPNILTQEPASLCTSAASSVVDDTESYKSVDGSRPKTTHEEELRCVISIIRHGDRTPKQKLKVIINEPLVLTYFHKHCKNSRKDLKIKEKAAMIEFLNTVKSIIQRVDSLERNMRDVGLLNKLQHMRDVLERWKIGGLNRKLQIKPRKWEEIIEEETGDTVIKATEVLLILKWGGNLTKLGEKQATQLGRTLRHKMYPDAPGGGILRLHSTFRHDLKIRTSDEGRVMKTAAAFAKGLLELEGEIPPILVSLVHKEKCSLNMLDPSGNKEVKEELDCCKENISKNLQMNFEFDKISVKEREAIVGPSSLISLHHALEEVHNPRKTLVEIHKTIGTLIGQLDDMLGVMMSGDEDRNEGGEGLKGSSATEEALSGIKLYKGETILELTERWRFIYKKLYDEDTDTFDLSRIPDVHDNVRFDMLHNPHLGLRNTLERLYEKAKLMADCVVPQEYGTTVEEKRSIGNKMCRALLEKIKYDLIIARTDNQVDMRYMINMEYSNDLPINTLGRRIRTRLYFTSESHLHTLLNVLRFQSEENDGPSSLLSTTGKEIISKTPELCYLTQIIIRLFENPTRDFNDPKRFRIEIFFSPGATATPLHMAEMDRDLDNSRFDSKPLELISKENLTCAEVEEYFSESINQGETMDDEDISLAAMEESKKEMLKKSQQKPNQIRKCASELSLQSNPQDSIPFAIDGATQQQLHGSGEKDIQFSKPGEDTNGSKEKHSSKSIEMTGNKKQFSDINQHLSNMKGKEDLHISSDSSEKQFHKEHNDRSDKERVERMARRLARRYVVRGAAAISLLLGVGCLVFARRMKDDVQIKIHRRRS